MKPARGPADAGGSFGLLARAGLLLTGAILISRLLGWLRLIIITAIFGATPELDAYFAAFRIPDALFQLVAGGVLSSVLIPEIANLRRESDDRAWRAVSAVTTLLFIGIGVLAGFALIGAPLVAPLIAPGFTAEQQALTADLSRIMLVSPICFLLGAVAASVLNAEGRFAAAALAPIVYNLGIVIAALALSPVMGIHAVAVGVALGAVAFLGMQLLPLASTSFRFTFGNPLADPAARQASLRLVPRSIGLAGTQLVFIACTMIASGLGVGAVTAYTLAYTALRIPVGLLGVPLGIVLFPSMARSAAANALEEFRRLLTAATRLALWAAALVTALGLLMPLEVSTVLYGHGALAGDAIGLVASTLAVFALGVGAHSLNLVLARAFYAARDTRTPVILTLIQVALSVTLAWMSSGTLGLPGVALGVAAGSWAKAIMMLVILHRARRLPAMSVARGGVAFVALAAVAGVAAWLVVSGVRAAAAGAGSTVEAALALVAGTVIGGGVYLAGSMVLRLPDVALAARIGREGLGRSRAR